MFSYFWIGIIYGIASSIFMLAQMIINSALRQDIKSAEIDIDRINKYIDEEVGEIKVLVREHEAMIKKQQSQIKQIQTILKNGGRM